MTNTETPEAVITPSESPRSIAKLAMALAKFQGEMPSVHKGKTAKVPMKAGGSYSYKYADLADVTAAAMPILSKHGLAFIVQPEEGSRGFILRGLLVHESGEFIEGILPLHGNANQELGSSLTYLRRYLLGALTGIVTDEDEDGAAGNTAERTTKVPARQRQSRAKPASASGEESPESSAPPAPPAAPVAADVAWSDKITEAATYDELTAVFNEADAAGVFGHMIGEETVKSRLYARRTELTSKDAQ